MAEYLRAGDVISGQEGYADAIIDGNVERLFNIKSLEAMVEKKKEEVRVMGKRGVLFKAAGFSGTGEMTLYYASTLFRRLVADYARTGRDVYFDITVHNEDPTSSIGAQTVLLKNCNIDSAVVAKLNVDEPALEETIKFTFDDMEILDSFVAPY